MRAPERNLDKKKRRKREREREERRGERNVLVKYVSAKTSSHAADIRELEGGTTRRRKKWWRYFAIDPVVIRGLLSRADNVIVSVRRLCLVKELERNCRGKETGEDMLYRTCDDRDVGIQRHQGRVLGKVIQ